MTLKKSIACLFAPVLIMTSLAANAWDVLTQEEMAIRDKVIRDMAREYAQSRSEWRMPLQNKIVLRGRIDKNDIRLETSNSTQLKNSLGNMKSTEASDLLSTRNMAIAGLSAGGILYFFPGKKIFFWETTDKNISEDNLSSDIIMNPVIGGILRGVLSNMQKNLRNNNGQFMGSQQAGSVMMVVLNPAASIVRSINTMAGRRVLFSGSSEIQTVDQSNLSRPIYMERPTKYLGLQFQIRY